MKEKITLSLISHTNIGKTTLARTLLKEDIGTVLDRPHTTLESQERMLLSCDSVELNIWDTPGFGGANASHIATRIREEGSAKGWLMHQVVDRIANRSLYSSVEAARNIRMKTDIVVYLVDNRTRPEEAGYLTGEFALLTELKKPVIVAVNHIRKSDTEELENTVRAWKRALQNYDIVKGVTILDAYSRVWFQEVELLKWVQATLTRKKKDAMGKLLEEYLKKQRVVEEQCINEIAQLVDFALHQRINLNTRPDKKEIFRRLFIPLETRLGTMVENLLDIHKLDSNNSPRLLADISMLAGAVSKRIPENLTGLVSGAVTGAGGGLAADVMAGGLTFGGGALLGFLVGGLTGIAAAKSINAFIKEEKEEEAGRWSNTYFLNLVQQSFLFYLLISHHGRGKGILDIGSQVKSWEKLVTNIVEQEKDGLTKAMSEKLEITDLANSLTIVKNRIYQALYPGYQV